MFFTKNLKSMNHLSIKALTVGNYQQLHDPPTPLSVVVSICLIPLPLLSAILKHFRTSPPQRFQPTATVATSLRASRRVIEYAEDKSPQ